MVCKYCGKEIAVGTEFCKYCGGAQDVPMPEINPSDDAPLEAKFVKFAPRTAKPEDVVNKRTHLRAKQSSEVEKPEQRQEDRKEPENTEDQKADPKEAHIIPAQSGEATQQEKEEARIPSEAQVEQADRMEVQGSLDLFEKEMQRDRDLQESREKEAEGKSGQKDSADRDSEGGQLPIKEGAEDSDSQELSRQEMEGEQILSKEEAENPNHQEDAGRLEEEEEILAPQQRKPKRIVRQGGRMTQNQAQLHRLEQVPQQQQQSSASKTSLRRVVILLVALVAAGCLFLNFSQNTEENPEQGEVQQGAVQEAGATILSLEQADEKIQGWLAEHTFPSEVTAEAISREKVTFPEISQEFYAFTLNGLEKVHTVLVDAHTGELYRYEGAAQPAEEWYQASIEPQLAALGIQPKAVKKEESAPPSPVIDANFKWTKFMEMKDGYLVGEMQNNSDQPHSDVVLEYAFYDEAGHEILRVKDVYHRIEAGESWIVSMRVKNPAVKAFCLMDLSYE